VVACAAAGTRSRQVAAGIEVRILNERRARALIWLFAAAVAVSLAASLMIGSVRLDPIAALTGLLQPADRSLSSAILALRLPRALTAIAVGGLLALSGSVLQALLRNPLADPYVLGISGGAACATMLAIAVGAGAFATHCAGVAGALAALAVLFLLARRALFGTEHLSGESPSSSMLLVGVMMASFAAAALSLALSLAPAGRLRPMVFWLLGDLSGALDPAAAWISLVVLAVCGWAGARDAAALNLMMRGDLQAFTQGVHVDHVRRRLVIVASIATGWAVALAGAIGFVGFVAPHLARFAVGNDQRRTLPASVLIGAVLLSAGDLAARTLAAPAQLPVGVLTVMIGVPVFLWQLRRQ
jgi:iron complex transport system permease protein